MKDFSYALFDRAPNLKRFKPRVEEMYNTFLEYKSKVPVYGAIMVDSSFTHALLVRGWKSKATWSFPRGKVNDGENERQCAIREVYEETGCDISNFLSHEFCEKRYREQKVRLYFGVGLPLETRFQPLARKEIGAVEWHELRGLYKEEKENGPIPHSKKYFMVLPFMSDLRKWITKKGGPSQAKKSSTERQERNSSEQSPQNSQRSISEPRVLRKAQPSKAGEKQKKGEKITKEKENNKKNRDKKTFGDNVNGWSVEEMFRVNADKFNVTSSYDYESYTIPLPSKEAPERSQSVQHNGRSAEKNDGLYLPIEENRNEMPKKASNPFNFTLDEESVMAAFDMGASSSY